MTFNVTVNTKAHNQLFFILFHVPRWLQYGFLFLQQKFKIWYCSWSVFWQRAKIPLPVKDLMTLWENVKKRYKVCLKNMIVLFSSFTKKWEIPRDWDWELAKVPQRDLNQTHLLILILISNCILLSSLIPPERVQSIFMPPYDLLRLSTDTHEHTTERNT